MKKQGRTQKNMSLSDALQGFIKANNLDVGMQKIDAKNAWFAVMGQAIEAYTDSVDLQNGTLVVRLSSSALREELSYGNSKIILNINEYLRKEVVTKLILA